MRRAAVTQKKATVSHNPHDPLRAGDRCGPGGDPLRSAPREMAALSAAGNSILSERGPGAATSGLGALRPVEALPGPTTPAPSGPRESASRLGRVARARSDGVAIAFPTIGIGTLAAIPYSLVETQAGRATFG
jgi:hypothetical protein